MGGSSGIIFLVIFLVIVAFLVVVGVYGSKKNKREKTKLLNDQKAIETTAKKEHIQLYVVLDLLIKKIDQEMILIEQGHSTKPIGVINQWASEILDNIKNSEELKSIYKSEDRKKEFLPIISLLYQTKATKWKEEAFFSINLIESKMKAFSQSKDYSIIIEETKKKYENIKFA